MTIATSKSEPLVPLSHCLPACLTAGRLSQLCFPGRPALLVALVLIALLGSAAGEAPAAQVSLAWNSVSGATGYKLYYGMASGSYSWNADAKTATSYTLTNLTDGTRYYFAVQAYNSTTTSGYSNEVSTVTGSTPPVASFSATPTSGTAPLTANFTDSSTGSITAWSWDFGNGSNSTSNSKNPSYTYSAAGTYTVKLTVTGPGGSNTSTKTNYISLSSPTGGGGSGGSTAVNPGLVAAYGFEEASGTQVIDASGFGNHGTISSAARVNTIQFGKALSFNGTNSWITINDSASLDLTTGMTLEAWVYPTAPMSGWRSVVLKEASGIGAYCFYANSDVGRPSTVVNVGGAEKILSAGPTLPINSWTHLAATYDGATQKLYVNGALVGSRTQTGSIALSSGPLRIGGTSLWSEYFTGYIDEVRIYNRALSSNEILQDFKGAVVGLVVSTLPDRSNSVPLNGLPVTGNIYVSYALISPTAATNPVKQVTFWLDDPSPNSPSGAPKRTETSSPFDFAGTKSDGTANPLSTAGLAKGVHSITAQVTLADGTVLPYMKGTFTIQ